MLRERRFGWLAVVWVGLLNASGGSRAGNDPTGALSPAGEGNTDARESEGPGGQGPVPSDGAAGVLASTGAGGSGPEGPLLTEPPAAHVDEFVHGDATPARLTLEPAPVPGRA